MLTCWGRVTHIYVGNLTTIGSNNDFSPGRCQSIIWTNIGILFIEPIRTNSCEISVGIKIFSLIKIHLKTSSGKWRPCCLRLNCVSIITILGLPWMCGYSDRRSLPWKWNVGHWGNVGHHFIMAMHNINPAAYAFQSWWDHLYEFQYCYMIAKIENITSQSFPSGHGFSLTRLHSVYFTDKYQQLTEALDFCSLSDKTSCQQTFWSFETATLDVIIIVPSWNLADISAALLPRCPWSSGRLEKS